MTRGRKLRLGLLLLILVVVVFIWLPGSSGPTIAPNSTLVLELSGSFAETTSPPLLARLLGDDTRSFVEVLSLLAMAERDERLNAVVLRIGSLNIGWGKAQELRDAIERMGESGRRTVVLLETGSLSANLEYYIACAADEVFVLPGAGVPLVGLAAEYIFLGGLWEKIGLEFDVARSGKFKSAVEGITGKGMSEASREMANSLLDSIYSQFVDGIASGRSMDLEAVRAAIDKGPVLPRDLLALGLIDGIGHLDDIPGFDRSGSVSGRVYAGVDPASVGFDPVARYALIYGSGTVVSGESGFSPGGSNVFAATTVSNAVHDAVEDPEIDGIILRIDSPGGSALASEELWYSIHHARDHEKPIIASFSDVAASGGYYVAVATDAIVSSPGTLTGSIGVFALRPIWGGVFDELGITVESLTRGRHADYLLSTLPPSEGSRKRLQATVLDIYQLFVERVAEGRDLDVSRVDALGQGRVWTGAQAFEVGLVDELGGLHAAVLRGKRELGLDADADVVLIPYPPARSLGEQLADLLQLRLRAMLDAALPVPNLVRTLQGWLADLPPGTPVLVPPILVEIR